MKIFSKKLFIITISVALAAMAICYGVTNYSKRENVIEVTSNSDEVQSTTIIEPEVAIEDPDLQLSIEELRVKYPIDWLEEKYGKVTPSNCLIVDDDPESGEAVIREISSWPCGEACKKHPQQKNCPKACLYTGPENLVCTFFKGIYEKNSQGREFFMEKPAVQFGDFSTSEIKSIFVHYNPNEYCKELEEKCTPIFPSKTRRLFPSNIY